MTQEIVYTSAEKGLRDGSTGFCTVRSTRGMPQNLSALLEQLTAYKHAFDAYQTSTSKHPVNYCHYCVRLGGEKLHILGRVANAPLDHTGRSNKLAHLIAVSAAELNSGNCGPAAESLALEKNWVTAWDGKSESKLLPDNKRIALPLAVDNGSRPCSQWQQITGHHGWAAVLAQTATDRNNKPVTIIFSIDQKDQCLQLVEEALSLIRPSDRWDVSFSTYYSGSLPTRVSCQWRFVLDTSELGRKARRHSRGVVIDLAKLATSQTAPPKNELSAFAGTIDRPWLRKKVRSKRASTKGETNTVPRNSQDSTTNDLDAICELQLEPDSNRRRGRRSSTTYSTEPRPSLARQFLPPLLATIAACAAIFGVVHFTTQRDSTPGEFEAIVSANDTRLQQERDAAALRNRQEKRAADKRQRDTQLADRAREAEEKRQQEQQAEIARQEKIAQATNASPDTKQTDVPVATTSDSNRLPFDDVRSRGGVLPIKPPQQAGTEKQVLCTVFAEPQDFVLDLTGSEAFLKANPLQTRRQDDSWIVKRKTGLTLEKIGTFRLRDNELSFRWDDPNVDSHLINCLLSLKSEKDRAVCSLRTPGLLNPIPIEFTGKTNKVSILPPGQIEMDSNLQFRIKATGLQHFKIESKGTTQVLSIFEDDDNDQPFLELCYSIAMADDNHAVYLKRETFSHFASYKVNQSLKQVSTRNWREHLANSAAPFNATNEQKFAWTFFKNTGNSKEWPWAQTRLLFNRQSLRLVAEEIKQTERDLNIVLKGLEHVRNELRKEKNPPKGPRIRQLASEIDWGKKCRRNSKSFRNESKLSPGVWMKSRRAHKFICIFRSTFRLQTAKSNW